MDEKVKFDRVMNGKVKFDDLRFNIHSPQKTATSATVTVTVKHLSMNQIT